MKIAAAFLGAASLLAVMGTGSNAQEILAQPLGVASGAPEFTLVFDGCGPGFIRNRFGRCQPRRFLGGYGYRRFGYGYRPYGYGYRRGFY